MSRIDTEVTIPSATGAVTLTINTVAYVMNPIDTAKTLTILGNMGVDINESTANQTVYYNPNGGQQGTTTETNAKHRVREPATASNLETHVRQNARTTDTIIRSRKNGANGNQLTTYLGSTSETGTKEDITNTDTLADGDDFNYSKTNSSGAGAFRLNRCSTQNVRTNRRFECVCMDSAGVTMPVSVVRYAGIAGKLALGTVEASEQVRVGFPVTWRKLGVRVAANTSTTSNCTITLMKGGVATALTLSIGAGAANQVIVDDAHTVDTVGADLLDFEIDNNDGTGGPKITEIFVVGEETLAATPVPIGRKAAPWHKR